MDFSTSELHRRKYVEWKQRGFFGQRDYTEKSTWKQRRRFDHQNYIEKKYLEITWIFQSAK